MNEAYPFKTANNAKPKKIENNGVIIGYDVPNLTGGSCKVTAPENWGGKIKDGSCPAVLDTLPYNVIIKSIEYKIL